MLELNCVCYSSVGQVQLPIRLLPKTNTS